MCRELGVSRSGWYSSRKRVRPTPREIRDAELLSKIREIHTRSRETYGSPRVHAQLAREGIKVGKDRVARLMKADGLQARVRPRFTVTTDSQHQRPVAPNTLNRDFQASASDSVWCADINVRADSGRLRVPSSNHRHGDEADRGVVDGEPHADGARRVGTRERAPLARAGGETRASFRSREPIREPVVPSDA